MDAPQLLLGALLFLVPAALLLLGLHRAGGKRPRLPPGPPSLPLLGSVVWLTNSPAEIEPLLRRLFARHGPVVALRVGARLSVFVADRRLAHAALVERGATLADRPALASARLLGENDNTITRASYGPVWRLLRRNLVAETLHPSRVRLFAPARAWVRRVLADKLGEAGRTGAPPPRWRRSSTPCSASSCSCASASASSSLRCAPSPPRSGRRSSTSPGA